eukprot:TRINITY_DN9448_c0_g1_i4.p1 TRINITY_DN9448_c0_g1~~TRINITY_DN9448_c0_g1_i4.p1  ORF type:complete len:115 (-),score=18.14 TRINITY_DN9448_c0_g1_i4:36-380(-)
MTNTNIELTGAKCILEALGNNSALKTLSLTFLARKKASTTSLILALFLSWPKTHYELSDRFQSIVIELVSILKQYSISKDIIIYFIKHLYFWPPAASWTNLILKSPQILSLQLL